MNTNLCYEISFATYDLCLALLFRGDFEYRRLLLKTRGRRELQFHILVV